MIVYAKRKEKKIIIDPKKNTFDVYRGATILTPNYNELMSVSRLKKINNESDDSIIKKITRNLIKD
jgi:bifunctional ADP-heptose synthase (sugar kinase/adenylyltransferase)